MTRCVDMIPFASENAIQLSAIMLRLIQLEDKERDSVKLRDVFKVTG